MTERNSPTWLSQGLESVAQTNGRLSNHESALDNFDVLIIGSGYGGAVAANHLSNTLNDQAEKLKIAVFERGKEYVQGSFPANADEAPTHIRYSMQNSSGPGGQQDGLFDFRLGTDLSVVVANGVGGGSLINAGVMLRPDNSVFDQRWPSPFNADMLARYYDKVELLLGVKTPDLEKNSILQHAQHSATSKLSALTLLASDKHAGPAPLSISMRQEKNIAGTGLNACTLCGDCAAGCNHGAKNSLDQNLLKRAVENGVKLITGATATGLSQRADGKWEVSFHHTNNQLKKTQNPVKVTAKKIILAAGALGSTEILLRAHANKDLNLSKQLGKKFSSNGDNFIAHYNQTNKSNSVAFEYDAPARRFIGPTITGMIDRRSSHGIVIQEMSVASQINRVFLEVCSTLNGIYDFNRIDDSQHHTVFEPTDIFTVDHRAFDNTSLYAVMGDDNSDGELVLCDNYASHSDACLKVSWPTLKTHELFERQVNLIESLSTESGTGGRIMPNPIWKLLPSSLMQLVGNEKGPTVTVHPLGGCAIANSADEGVADEFGRLFDLTEGDSSTQTKKVHDSLVVMDGSILPCALGINPALTIAAVALRNITELVQLWGWKHGTARLPLQLPQPPVLRALANSAYNPPVTTFTMLERLRGFCRTAARIPGSIGEDSQDLVVEITLKTAGNDLTTTGYPKAEVDLNNWKHHPLATNHKGQEPTCYLRIFRQADWTNISNACRETEATEQALDELCTFKALIAGDIHLFGQEESNSSGRIRSAFHAWLFNRGIRDIGQYLFPRYYEKPDKPVDRSTFRPVASRAGSRWLINYDLTIEKVTKNALRLRPKSNRILGKKTITYRRRANPWRQLTEVELNDFLGLELERAPVLRLDTSYLSDRSVPLYEFQSQANQVRAGLDAFSFGMYTLRLLIHTHLWSFRLPDRCLPEYREVPSYPRAQSIDRLARQEPGIAAPDLYFLDISPNATGTRFVAAEKDSFSGIGARLAHYSSNASHKASGPILMLHGYSASSTTFSHPDLKHSAARFFLDKGHDVWLLDLRSSAGLAGASTYWRFDDIASTEINKSIDFISEFYQRQKTIDILAHCMGGAMLSMTLCSNRNSVEDDQLYRRAIGKIAFSQFSPTPVFTPFNTFRAMTVNALKSLFKGSYEFRGTRERALLTDILDRLLTTIPMSDDDFDQMNPTNPLARRTYSRSKQRADALYSRVMNISEMSPQLLNQFDDFFGPLNLETATQVMHFARSNRITDFRGHGTFIEPVTLRKKWHYPTISLHSARNGMIDRRSGATAEKVFLKAGANYKPVFLKNRKLGHQDAMIGEHAHRDVFPIIADFFNGDAKAKVDHDQQEKPAWTIEHPEKGPVIFRDGVNIRIGFGTNERNAAVRLPILIPLAEPNNPKIVQRETIQCAIEATLKHARCWRDEDLSPSWYTLNASDLGVNATAVKRQRYLLCLASDEAGHYQITLDSNDTTANGSFKSFCVIDANKDEPAENPQSITDSLTDEILNWLRGDCPDGSKHLCPSIDIAAEESELCFAFGSCQYPAGLFDRTLAYRSYAALAKHLDSADIMPNCLVLMGDQIYSDATAGLMDPRLRYDRYVRPHLNWYSQPEVKKVLQQLPLYAMLDDHEIIDNWDPARQNTGKQATSNEKNSSEPELDYLQHGVSAFKKFQRGQAFDESENCWYQFESGGSPFFMLDTRTERSARYAENLSHKDKILGDKQHRALEDWLLETAVTHAGSPRFVVSPSILLPRHVVAHDSPDSASGSISASSIHSDTWDGYPASLHQLLSFICDHRLEDIYFLSGDEHLNCYALIELQQGSNKPLLVRSIHCSGLYAPIPFANAKPSDFIGELTPKEQDGKRYDFRRDEFYFNNNFTPKNGDDAKLAKSKDYHCVCQFGFELDDAHILDPTANLSVSTIEGFGLIQNKPRTE